MTDVVRLILVSHAQTDAMAAPRFPADEPLNATGHRQAQAVAALGLRDLGGQARQLVGPEQRARQTAQLLGLAATTEPRLADLDCGRWQGQALQGVPPEELRVWLCDPAQAPHGGESIVNLIDRIAGWLESLESLDPLSESASRTVAVTHPAVIRAAVLLALDVGPKSFWRIDITPLSRTVMHFRGHRWTLRL
ncbi:histidine phosphatase family protein [Mycobacterium spongiae]|uniref:Histidine phosphatase family protein n=1 Tax=Mycobacterium spongiae TaxID=886343 RepID=A0A975K0L1_9MYCO|nr:histidine phosphatase family protein [Mycobacterium spongiae]QUR69171.1 histidine phosphatase family protein [Mycobacterium spongiae]